MIPLERRSRARELVDLEPGLKPGLAEQLVRCGWTVRSRAIEEAELSETGLLVTGLRAMTWLRELRGTCVALLLDAAGADDVATFAADVTPFVYDRSLPAEVLARLLTRAAGVGGRAARDPEARAARVTSVTIRLGDAVEVDGVPAQLGVAERNFLYLLAAGPHEWLAKDALVEAGRRKVAAGECRRRLGKRLGAELAALLVPQSRHEPYRLRSSVELERDGRVRLRVIGRSSVRSIAFGDLDGFPER